MLCCWCLLPFAPHRRSRRSPLVSALVTDDIDMNVGGFCFYIGRWYRVCLLRLLFLSRALNVLPLGRFDASSFTAAALPLPAARTGRDAACGSATSRARLLFARLYEVIFVGRSLCVGVTGMVGYH